MVRAFSFLQSSNSIVIIHGSDTHISLHYTNLFAPVECAYVLRSRSPPFSQQRPIWFLQTKYSNERVASTVSGLDNCNKTKYRTNHWFGIQRETLDFPQSCGRRFRALKDQKRLASHPDISMSHNVE